MKININKKDLSSLAALVSRAASTKNTIPVLSGLLIQAISDKGLVMTATDMEIGIKASTPNVEIIEEGSVLVNAHYFTNFIKLLPDGLISIELDRDKSKLNIKYGRSSVSYNKSLKSILGIQYRSSSLLFEDFICSKEKIYILATITTSA